MSKLRKAGERAMQSESVSLSHSTIQATSQIFGPGGLADTRTFSFEQPARIPMLPPHATPPAHTIRQQSGGTSSAAASGHRGSDPKTLHSGSPTIGEEPLEEEVEEEPQPQIFRDFEERKAAIIDILFHDHTADGLGQPCPCGAPNAIRTTVCRECWHYTATCTHCFVESHIRAPTHWAEVWSADRGFFVRHDISALPGSPHIHLGHGGHPCPNGSALPPKEVFTVVDLNGIHSTKIQFCGCGSEVDRADQLLNARLFPSSFRRPRMAFTMALLRNFHVRHLQSAEPAYDFIASLRHLTDDFFFKDAADPYDPFRDVFKIYRILEAEIRLGQLHGIDEYFPNRRSGNLSVLCPACVEPGVNTTCAEQSLTDRRLRHLYQICLTGDGNFQANRYIKSSDARRISLFRGKAYFPHDKGYKVFVVRTEAKKSTAKSTCGFLNAINKQEKSKFIGTDVSGVLNIQCSHVFILSSVDLQYGERFVCTDYALYHAFLQRGIPKQTDLENLDWLFSYDIGCHYEINAVKRFREQLPEATSIIQNFRQTIPLVHVRNHKDNCTYLYSSAYIDCAGHFHGETAEQPWAYSNGFGGQGRQMSNGNRQDMFIGVYDFWNRMKELGLPSQLFNDLMRAASLKDIKREVFIRTCRTYIEKVQEWNKQPRGVRDRSKTEVECVYRHKPSKLPSQTKIYQALVQKAESQSGDKDDASKERLKAPVLLLNHSVTIRKLQVKIRSTDAAYKTHETPSLKTKLVDLRSQLQTALKRFRNIQASVTPQVAQDLREMKRDAANSHPEMQCLHLPSDYTEGKRIDLNLTELGAMEYKMLEGAAYDTLEKLRTIVRLLSTLRKDENDNAYGQTRHTRAKSQIIDATVRQDTCMKQYNLFRKSLISLGLPEDDPSLLELTFASLDRKSTTATRNIGDTYKADGLLWASGAINADRRLTHRPLINAQASSTPDMVGTLSSQALKRKIKKKDGEPNKKPRTESQPAQPAAPPNPQAASANSAKPGDDQSAGWIWAIKSSTAEVTDAEVEDYLSEGDRVLWFRAEAEMYRWQEEWERKIMEFVRTIRYYDKMSNVWGQLSSSSKSTPGKAAFAMKTSKRYHELRRRCEDIFKQAGFVYRRGFQRQVEESVHGTTTQQSVDGVLPGGVETDKTTGNQSGQTGGESGMGRSNDESDSGSESSGEDEESRLEDSEEEQGNGMESSEEDQGGGVEGSEEEQGSRMESSGEEESGEESSGEEKSGKESSEEEESGEESSEEEESGAERGGSETSGSDAPLRDDSSELRDAAAGAGVGASGGSRSGIDLDRKGDSAGSADHKILTDDTIIPFMQNNRDALEQLLAAAMTVPSTKQSPSQGSGGNQSAPSRSAARRGRGRSRRHAVR